MFRIVRLEMFLVILFIVITFSNIAVRTENTTVSTTDSTNASTTENTIVLTTDNISVSTTENTSVQKTYNSSVSTTENTTVPTTDNSSVSTTENTTVVTTDNISVSTKENTTVPTTDNSSVSTTENITVPTTDNSSLSTTAKTIAPTTDNSSVSTTENTIVPTTENSSVSTTEIITVPKTDNSSVSTTEHITLPTTDNNSVSTTENTAVPRTDNSSMSTTESTTVTTTYPSPPGRPANVSVVGVTSSSITISWIAPENVGGGITSYVIRYISIVEDNNDTRNCNNTIICTEQMDTTQNNVTTIILENLQACTLYQINVSGNSSYGEGPASVITSRTNESAREEKEPTHNLPVIIGSVVGSVLAFIIFGIVSIYIWRRQSEKRLTKAEYREDNVAFEGKGLADIREKRPVQLSDFHTHFETLSKNSNLLFSQAYKELNAISPKFSTSASEIPETTIKNRYINIVPFNKSRVKLAEPEDEPGSDYINANYVPGFSSEREYIATQGPLASTINDLWRMIWENNVSILVMLTQCMESEMIKCEQYWPKNVNESVLYGDFLVHMESESHSPDFILRTFVLRLGDIERTVRHYYYLLWPDMGIPASTDDMLRFVDAVRRDIRPDMIGPIVVHCSTGVGRTGAYILLDTIIRKIQSGEDNVDIFGDILNLRNFRMKMVETKSQFVYVHECINDYLKLNNRIYENVTFTKS